MKKIFGTDGVRGTANTNLTPELAFSLGRVGSYVITKHINSEKKFMIIGRDTRQSGDMLAASLSAGICSLGVDVWDIGVAPTPIIAWLIRKYGAIAGVVISASHNPAKDNGIKFFNEKGKKLADEIELEIEEVIEKNETIDVLEMNSNIDDLPRPSGIEVGRICYKADVVADYIDFVKDLVKFPIKDLKVGLDTANGANFNLAPKVYDELGINYKVIHNSPNGKNINLNCGSTHLENLKELVKNEGLDIGIAFDGDADRVLAVDKNGEEIDGDQIMFICSKYLPYLSDNNSVVATVMSNIGFEIAVKNLKKDFLRAKVGDRYVSEMIESTGAKIGGEQSGHIIFPEFNTSGDGLLTSLMLLEAIHRSKKSVKELKEEMSLFPQVLINVPVQTKKGLDSNESIIEAIKKSESNLGNKGRVLVRPSGTEPLVRVMVEGEEENIINQYANEIAEVIKKELSIA